MRQGELARIKRDSLGHVDIPWTIEAVNVVILVLSLGCTSHIFLAYFILLTYVCHFVGIHVCSSLQVNNTQAKYR